MHFVHFCVFSGLHFVFLMQMTLVH